MLGMPFLSSGFYPRVLLVAAGWPWRHASPRQLPCPRCDSARLAPAIAMHSDPNKPR